jgi:anti-sigma factor RsiW
VQRDHPTFEELSALLDDELAEAEAGDVRSHLVTCVECRAEIDRLRATVSLLRLVPVAAPPRSFRLDQPPPAPLLRLPAWRLPSPLALRGLAGVAAALMVVLFLADATGPAVSPSRSVAPAVGLSAPAAGDSQEDRAGPQAPRAVAPQRAPGAAAGGPAQAQLAPTPSQLPSFSPPGPAAERSVDTRQSGSSDTWATPGRIGVLGLGVVAVGLLLASFLIRREA